jgi:FkbM family methyltransferase
MHLRDLVQSAGRSVTRVLLHPALRKLGWVTWGYSQLYVLGKRLTESNEERLLSMLVEPGMTIADIGANIGFYSLRFAAWVGSNGRVLAFEPDPTSYQLLARRAGASGTTWLETYQVALGDRTGEGLLHCSAYNRADNRLHESNLEAHVESVPVRITTLDQFIADHRIGGVDALKIDVQGWENAVLRGALDAVGRGNIKWIWLEFSPDHLRGAGVDPLAFLEMLLGLPFDLAEVTEDGRLATIPDLAAYQQRIGHGYGDLLLSRLITSIDECEAEETDLR